MSTTLSSWHVVECLQCPVILQGLWMVVLRGFGPRYLRPLAAPTNLSCDQIFHKCMIRQNCPQGPRKHPKQHQNDTENRQNA